MILSELNERFQKSPTEIESTSFRKIPNRIGRPLGEIEIKTISETEKNDEII